MEAPHQRALRKHLVVLCNCLEIIEVVTFLRQNDCITEWKSDSIKNQSTKYDRNNELITWLQKQPYKTFEIFCDALDYSKQSHLSKKLWKYVAESKDKKKKQRKPSRFQPQRSISLSGDESPEVRRARRKNNDSGRKVRITVSEGESSDESENISKTGIAKHRPRKSQEKSIIDKIIKKHGLEIAEDRDEEATSEDPDEDFENTVQKGKFYIDAINQLMADAAISGLLNPTNNDQPMMDQVEFHQSPSTSQYLAMNGQQAGSRRFCPVHGNQPSTGSNQLHPNYGQLDCNRNLNYGGGGSMHGNSLNFPRQQPCVQVTPENSPIFFPSNDNLLCQQVQGQASNLGIVQNRQPFVGNWVPTMNFYQNPNCQ